MSDPIDDPCLLRSGQLKSTAAVGPIVGRTREHLVASDKAVATARHLVITAAKNMQRGEDPRISGSTAARFELSARCVEKRDIKRS